ncbi:uncharacterized protein TrAtP1_003543 [Trichoderma atroviride]|uniref:uncharacterized protein n=1 Tax=Hypocrea atroviridis TaxID=63577 RepID=UPI00332A8784|nr:hypothetical protein TrAtP1_003543 [Trichoderma atroviride]
MSPSALLGRTAGMSYTAVSFCSRSGVAERRRSSRLTAGMGSSICLGGNGVEQNEVGVGLGGVLDGDEAAGLDRGRGREDDTGGSRAA